MARYQVSKSAGGLSSSSWVEAASALIAAETYVKDNKMADGTYLVREVIEPIQVEVFVTTTVEAKYPGE